MRHFFKKGEVNGKWSSFIQRLYPKRCTVHASHSPTRTHIHKVTHQQQLAPTSSSGAIGVRRLAQCYVLLVFSALTFLLSWKAVVCCVSLFSVSGRSG